MSVTFFFHVGWNGYNGVKKKYTKIFKIVEKVSIYQKKEVIR